MTGYRIGVVGAGAVGQAVGALLATQQWCGELRLASRRRASAAALAADLLDMQHTTSPTPYCRITDAEVEDLTGCDAVVLCPRAAFVNTSAHDVRMAGITANAPAIEDITARLGDYSGTVVVVTNPVDVMARHTAAHLPAAQVWGIGSNTDTARYRLALASYYRVPTGAVDGVIIGEHGDAMVICASTTTVHGRRVHVPVQRIRAELAARPRHITAGIGRTRGGPAGAVAAALRVTLGVADGVQVLSTSHQGVWIGCPVAFTGGRPSIQLPSLTTEEAAQFSAAHDKLAHAYQQITPVPEGTPLP